MDFEEAAASQTEYHENMIARIASIKGADPVLLKVVIDRANKYFSSVDYSLVSRWLFQPMVMFDGLMPVELAIMGRGEEVVEFIDSALDPSGSSR